MFVCPECGGPQAAEGACPLDNTPLAPIGEDVMLGTTIGAYRVAHLLGIGGMGRVYKGVHPTIGSRVAIKVLSRECTDRRDLVDRFFAEARAVNLIRHESIVNVLDLAVLPDGRPYIIMEYLDGAPLGAILEHAQLYQTPLPLGGLARLAVEVLDALHAAHAKGIVHRDLKPDNVFVTPSGRPKVLDFGIARFTDPGGSGGGSTRTGSLLGTPHYMSPEQAAGKPVDHRADIYAIGVILFECATGRKPFAAESLFELLRKHVEEPPQPPRMFRPELGEPFEQVILCALAKSPEQRFGSAQAMSMALQHATAQLPQEAWRPITGSGTHRAPSLAAGWQGSAPSWPSRAVPRPSEQPLPNYDPISKQSTVSASAGQMQRQAPAKKSKTGLWVALTLVALIGVGATIAVVANSSDDSSDVAGPPSETKPDEAKPDQVAKVDEAKGDPKIPSTGDELERQIGDLTKDLPDDVRKQVEAQAREAAKRMRELENINRQPRVKPGAPPPKPGDDTKAEADPPDDDPTDPPAVVPKNVPAGPWDWETKTITPGGWNPKRVNVAQFIGFAMAAAKKHVPDAQLTRIGVTGVSPDGFANLELPTLASDSGDIELRFISPSKSKPDPKQPAGIPVKLVCEFRIMGEPDGVEITAMFATNCKEIVVPPLRCSIDKIWKLALAHKAPTNAVANINYYRASMHNTGKIFFAIGFGHDVSFSKMWTDADCPN
jgi:serine/threonine protein kinase